MAKRVKVDSEREAFPKPRPSRGKKDESVAEKAKRFIRTKEAAKRGYQRADRILAEIAEAVKPGDEITLSENGRKAVLVDCFEGKTVLWGHGAVRRWDLEVTEP